MTQLPGQVARRVEGRRLVWYAQRADQAYWDTLWASRFCDDVYRSAEEGGLGRFEAPFTTYLPRQGRILEAGCGMGQHVLALRHRGYDVEGVEWGSETVRHTLRLKPCIPIRAGDVTRLGVPDGWYAGYISLGVIEHRREGPEPFLVEANRVLESGGIALISVPFFNPLRRVKALLRMYDRAVSGLSFYQYAFTEKELDGLLRAAGFKVIRRFRYDRSKGFDDELPFLGSLYRLRGVGWRLRRFVTRSAWLEHRFGHMTMSVCLKAKQLVASAVPQCTPAQAEVLASTSSIS